MRDVSLDRRRCGRRFCAVHHVHKPSAVRRRSGSRCKLLQGLVDQASCGGIAGERPGPVEHGEGSAGVLADRDPGFDVVGAPGSRAAGVSASRGPRFCRTRPRAPLKAKGAQANCYQRGMRAENAEVLILQNRHSSPNGVRSLATNCDLYLHTISTRSIISH